MGNQRGPHDPPLTGAELFDTLAVRSTARRLFWDCRTDFSIPIQKIGGYFGRQRPVKALPSKNFCSYLYAGRQSPIERCSLPYQRKKARMSGGVMGNQRGPHDPPDRGRVVRYPCGKEYGAAVILGLPYRFPLTRDWKDLNFKVTAIAVGRSFYALGRGRSCRISGFYPIRPPPGFPHLLFPGGFFYLR
jgi:hypothetical protein